MMYLESLEKKVCSVLVLFSKWLRANFACRVYEISNFTLQKDLPSADEVENKS